MVPLPGCTAQPSNHLSSRKELLDISSLCRALIPFCTMLRRAEQSAVEGQAKMKVGAGNGCVSYVGKNDPHLKATQHNWYLSICQEFQQKKSTPKISVE